MPVPGASQTSWTVATLAAMPAVQLFVARAQAADATFELSPANAAAVAELSRRLEGLPLAVELAAARIRLLEPEALLARMDQSLPLLRWDAPDLPARHRSLHATLDWSYALLTPDQQALFRRLAVFAGGFTLEGAEAVFTGDVPGADEGAGDGLLYRRPTAAAAPLGGAGGPGGAGRPQPGAAVARPDWEEPRYRMLETVREFGLEQLQASGEEERGAAAAPGLPGGTGRAALRADLAAGGGAGLGPAGRRARRRASGAGMGGGERGGGAGAAAGAGDGHLLGVRGHLREGRGWLERALGWGAPTPSPERARALSGLGWLARFQGDSDRAEAAFGEALRTAAAAGARLTRRGRCPGWPWWTWTGAATRRRRRGWTRRWRCTSSWSRRWSAGPSTSVGPTRAGGRSPSPPATWPARPATWRRRSGGSGRWASPGG